MRQSSEDREAWHSLTNPKNAEAIRDICALKFNNVSGEKVYVGEVQGHHVQVQSNETAMIDGKSLRGSEAKEMYQRFGQIRNGVLKDEKNIAEVKKEQSQLKSGEAMGDIFSDK
ncbi:MAG: hypothetical protein WC451_02475 [Patescibacteria group bacterium]